MESVEQTLPFSGGGLSVLLVLGTAEMVLGALTISGILLRISLFVLVAHLIGTHLSTFAVVPWLMISEGILLLTTEGEFVAKNGALIAGALVLLTHARKQGPDHGADHSKPH